MNKALIAQLVADLQKVASERDLALTSNVLALGDWHLQEKANKQVLKQAGLRPQDVSSGLTKEASGASAEDRLYKLLAISTHK